MKIHEYQGKELLLRYGVAVPRGVPCFSVDEALQAAQSAQDFETMEVLRQRYASDKAKIEAEREAKKDRVRGV